MEVRCTWAELKGRRCDFAARDGVVLRVLILLGSWPNSPPAWVGKRRGTAVCGARARIPCPARESRRPSLSPRRPGAPQAGCMEQGGRGKSSDLRPSGWHCSIIPSLLGCGAGLLNLRGFIISRPCINASAEPVIEYQKCSCPRLLREATI